MRPAVFTILASALMLRCGASAAEPPPDAIALFTGADMAHWVRVDGGAPGWAVTNGVLTIVPGSGSIRTLEKFEDFELHLEFRFFSNSPAGTTEANLINSGIFLQDQFEIQIMESFGRPLSGGNDGGAIWSIRDANSNASLPGGNWEEYDIQFRASRWNNGVKTANARVSLWWNDVLVHDNVEIPRPTEGGAPPEASPPASIRLQDLVGVVQFRNIWVRPLDSERPPAPQPVTLVPAGSLWRFLDDGSNQEIAWRLPAFNDSGWSTGLAELGYGDGDEKTLIRSNRVNGTRIQTTYFRRSFVATNVWAFTNLTVSLLRDDGGVIYLNGAEVFRSNITNVNVAYTDWASATVNTPEELRFFGKIIDPDLLIEGTNVIAVEVHQVSASSSDLSFDFRMTALAYPRPQLRLSLDASGIRIRWPANPSGFTIETSPTIGPEASWTPVLAPAVETNGFKSVPINPAEEAEYFRLRR